MSPTRTYPNGVPSWVDTEQPDPQAAQQFYGELLGWTFTTVSQPDTPFYAMASLDGRDVAGLAAAEAQTAAWNTYFAVDDADRSAEQVAAGGGEVVAGPIDVSEAGRMAICRDPEGAAFRLWQAGRHAGAQMVNARGSWNFSDLHTAQAGNASFYSNLFGWEIQDLGFATLVRSPGYADHLEATIDPGIRARQQDVGSPPGFEDAIAWVSALEPGTSPRWHISFAVADRDAIAASAQQLGGHVLENEDSRWTRTALIRDPQGAVFTASQFTPHG